MVSRTMRLRQNDAGSSIQEHLCFHQCSLASFQWAARGTVYLLSVDGTSFAPTDSVKLKLGLIAGDSAVGTCALGADGAGSLWRALPVALGSRADLCIHCAWLCFPQVRSLTFSTNCYLLFSLYLEMPKSKAGQGALCPYELVCVQKACVREKFLSSSLG